MSKSSSQKLFSTAQEIEDLVANIYNEVTSANNLGFNGTQGWVAFDTEFIRESTFFPVVEILQIATETQAWLVDIRAFRGSGMKGLDSLRKLFVDPRVTKILHAYSGDQECLFTLFGEVASPVFDTALAASLLGYGDNIGLAKLHKDVLGIELQKGNARTNWSVRPLPEHLMRYALEDVVHLVKLAKELSNSLTESKRAGAALALFKKAEDKSVFEIDVDGIVRRLNANGRLNLKGLWVLRELVRWRETKARMINIPRRWLAEDSVLLDLSRVAPKDEEHLLSFRGLNRGEAKKDANTLLEVFKKSETLTEHDLAEVDVFENRKRLKAPTGKESQVIEFLKFYFQYLADKHQVSVRHLITQDQALPLVRAAHQATNLSEFKKISGLTDLAFGLVGEEVFALLRGEKAISIQNQEIQVVNRSMD